MKYINTKYLLFDRITGSLITTNEGICSDGRNDNFGYITINTDKTKMYFMVKHRYDGTDNYVNGEIIRILLKNGTDLNVYAYPSSNKYSLCRDSVGLVSVPTAPNKNFSTIYLELDLESGDIIFKVDSHTEYKNNPYVKGTSVVEFGVGAKYYTDAKKSVIKDIIVSDEPIKMNETIKEIPIEEVSSEWENTDGTYSTDENNKRIVFNANTNGLERYNIKSAQLAFESSQSSETINTLKVNIGDEIANMNLSDTGQSSYSQSIKNPDLNNEISVES